MKILLIQPPYPFSEFPKPSWALMSLGALLHREGYEVEVLDLLSTAYSAEKIERRLHRFQPDVIGTTSVTLNFPAAVRILKACKEIHPEARTVMGGPHVTFTAEETLRKFPEVEIIVKGEGEETLTQMLSAFQRGSELEKIPGLVYRRNDHFVDTGSRPLLKDLDSLPLPERTLFPLSRYLAMRVPASVISSRGCPTGCTFCVGYRMMGRQGRFRDPVRVGDEIEAACRLGFDEICIDDDLFTRNRAHVLKICDEINRRDLRIKLYIFARVDTVEPVLLRRLREAGCAMICFGLESGNQNVLDKAGKRTTLEKARQAVRASKDAGIAPLGSFILGLPGETPESMAETISFAQSLEIAHGFHLLSPFPGTDVRERAAEFGLKILSNDWSLYDADHAITETESLPAVQVQAFARSFFGNLTAEIENMKKGTLAGTYQGPYREEMEKRLEVDFAWKLLSGDILEEHGRIPRSELINGESLGVLGSKISELTSLPGTFVGARLTKLRQKGLISCRETAEFDTWQWREG